MKQIEITTRVNETLEEAIKKLEKHGFKKVRESKVKDIYLTQKKKDLNKKNIIEILSSCVLLRYLKINDEQVIKKITYKNKRYKSRTCYKSRDKNRRYNPHLKRHIPSPSNGSTPRKKRTKIPRRNNK